MKTWHGLLVLVLAAGALSAGDVEVQGFTNLRGWRIDWKPAPKEVLTDGKLKVTGSKVYALGELKYPQGGVVERTFTGIAFKVRGDGSDEWSRISIQAGPISGGSFYFPLKNKEVVEYRVAFSDMGPNNDNSLLPPAKIMAGEISGFQVGDRWRIGQNNSRRPAFGYEISDLRLIDDVKGKFVPGKFRPAPLETVIAKMKAKKKVLILCFGDSITAGTSLRDKDKDRYATVLQGLLRQKYGYDGITVRSVAVGGAHTYDSIGWLDRDLVQGKPDAATMLIGYNNRSSQQTRENYAAHLGRWIELFAMKTGCQAPVVLIPSVPGVPRFFAQRDMAEATYEVAKKYGLDVAPVEKAIEKIGPVEYRKKYLADGIHPNPAGHKLFADVLLKVFCK